MRQKSVSAAGTPEKLVRDIRRAARWREVGKKVTNFGAGDVRREICVSVP
jgi:hypothetical protein